MKFTFLGTAASVYEPRDIVPPVAGPKGLLELDLGTAVVESFIDVKDEANLQFDGSNNITVLNDVITGGAITVSNATADRNGIYASGVNNMSLYLTQANMGKDIPAGVGLTLVLLSKNTGNGGANNMAMWHNTLGDYCGMSFLNNASSVHQASDGNGQQDFSFGVARETNLSLDVVRIEGSTVSRRLNGVAFANQTITNPFAGGAAMQELDIGYNFTNANGDYVAEAIVLSGALTDAQLQLIEGYVAHRHNAASILDAGHPYKSVAP